MLRRSLGASRRYLLNQLDRPAVILLYHRVTHLKNDPQLLSVTPENFYEQVSLLRKKYTLLKIEEFSDLITRKKKIPRNAVVLTFDDGYADNYQEALPILESLNSQALFYITTSNLDTNKELWWDELERIFLCDAILPPSIDIAIRDKPYHFPTATVKERFDIYYAIHPLLKYTSIAERNKVISELQQWAGLSTEGRSTHRLVTIDELQKMNASAAAVIGAHTINHPALSTLSYEEQLSEICLSKAFLEKMLDKEVEHFSYPFGSKKDYNRNSIKACKESGFKIVCANYYNQAHSWTDIFQVPRILVRNWDKPAFIQQLPKFFKY